MIISEQDIDDIVAGEEKIRRGKECATCGHSFTPIDDKDRFCKKCLRNLYHELLRDIEPLIDKIGEVRWRIEETKKLVKLHTDIQKVKP